MFANRYGLEYGRISQRPEETLADQTRHIDVARCSVVVFEMERVFRPRCREKQLSSRSGSRWNMSECRSGARNNSFNAFPG